MKAIKTKKGKFANWDRIFLSYKLDKGLIYKYINNSKNFIAEKLIINLPKKESEQKHELCPKICDKMFSILNHQRNANLNH